MSRASSEPVMIESAFYEQKNVVYPRPVSRPIYPRTSYRTEAAPQSLLGCRSRLTSSLTSQDSCGASELRDILQNPTVEPKPSYFGVSPPVRSGFCGGACNPLAHDSKWKFNAYSASHTNLQALRELDSAGISFLRTATHSADAALVLGSPECRDPAPAVAPVAGAAAALSHHLAAAAAAAVAASNAMDGPHAAAKAAPFACSQRYFPV